MTTTSDTRKPIASDEFLVRVWREHARLKVGARERLAQIAMHDLRSPLNGMQGWVQVLESRLDTTVPLVQRALDGVRNCIVQQTQILDDTADMLKLMGVAFESEGATAALEEVVAAAVAGASTAASARQIEFSRYLEPGLRVAGEPADLERALRYVLLYAVRCASAGDVLSVITSPGEAEQGACLRIAPATQAAATEGDVNWGALPHPPLVWQLAQGLIEWHGGQLRAAMVPDGSVPERFEVRFAPGGDASAALDVETRRRHAAERLQLFAATLPVVGVIDGSGADNILAAVRATGADVQLFANASALHAHQLAHGRCDVLLLPASGQWDSAYARIPCLLYGSAPADGELSPHVLAKMPEPCEPLHTAAFIVTAANSVEPDSRLSWSQ